MIFGEELDQLAEAARDRVAQLPRVAARQAGSALLNGSRLHTSPPYHRSWGTYQDKFRHATWLDTGPKATRSKLFAALHPGLGELMHAWWDRSIDRAIERGRRFPSNPARARVARLEHLAFLLQFSVDPALTPDVLSQYCSGVGSRPLHALFATAIDLGDRELFDTCYEAAGSLLDKPAEAEHCVTTLLHAAEPAGWDLVVSQLEKAGRRDSYALSVMLSGSYAEHAVPGAFNRLVATVADTKNFSIPAFPASAGGWLGTYWRRPDAELAKESTQLFRRCLEDPDEVTKTLRTGSGGQMWVALVAAGRNDATHAAALARPYLDDSDTERHHAASRAVAVDPTVEDLVALLGSNDLRSNYAAARATERFAHAPAVFEALMRLVDRLPQDHILMPAPLLERRSQVAIDRGRLLQRAMRLWPDQPLDFALPYLDSLTTRALAAFCNDLGSLDAHSPAVRAAVEKLAQSRKPDVRAAAKAQLVAAEVEPS